MAEENAFTSIAAFITILGLILAPVGMVIRFWSRRPRLFFRLDKAETETQSVFTVMNLGHREARDVKVRWFRRSAMDMEPVPQPTVVPVGQSLPAILSIEKLDLVTHAVGLSRNRPREGDPLGWVEVTYRGPILRKRTGRAIVVAGLLDHGAVSSSLALTDLPRRPLIGVLPWLAWLDKKLGLAERRQRRVRERRARDYADRLAQAWQTLKENSIFTSSGEAEEDVSPDILIAELVRRGWRWEYGPGGDGYEFEVSKRWYRSSSMHIVATGKTLLDSAVLALNPAIQEDRERGTDIGPYQPTPIEGETPSTAPVDPGHDLGNHQAANASIATSAQGTDPPALPRAAVGIVCNSRGR